VSFGFTPAAPVGRRALDRLARQVRHEPKLVAGHRAITDECSPREAASVTSDTAVSDAAVIGASLTEPDRFAEIFDRHVAAIQRFACARLGPDLGEEVTAETFLAAFSRRAHYDRARPDARPWLYGIAVRQIGRHRRAEARQRKALESLPVGPLTDDPGERSAERVTAEQFRSRLASLLSDLPRQDRELLLLIAWADLSYAEAAQALGITVSAVRSRLNRVRVRAREALGGINPVTSGDEFCDE
jgi:RNA polymerase sigma factor (sigma-70 family)